MLIPEPTIRDVFSGVEQLMGSTAAAQSLLRRSPKSFACGIKRLATNLSALQQLYGCSEQQAQKVLLRAAQLAPLKLEAPKFQCRVAALTEWYGHASPGGCAGQTSMCPDACCYNTRALADQPVRPSMCSGDAAGSQ
jgi:hypothetical protein